MEPTLLLARRGEVDERHTNFQWWFTNVLNVGSPSVHSLSVAGGVIAGIGGEAGCWCGGGSRCCAACVVCTTVSSASVTPLFIVV